MNNRFETSIIRLPRPEIYEFPHHKGSFAVHAVNVGQMNELGEESIYPAFEFAYAGVETVNEIAYTLDRRKTDLSYKGYWIISTTVTAIVGQEVLLSEEFYPVRGWRNQKRIISAKSNAAKLVGQELRRKAIPVRPLNLN